MPGDTLNINNKAAAQNTYDAIVIGSGISGGWAAKELTEKGLKVLMLERGRSFEHIKDYETASKDPWDLEHRGQSTAEERKNYPLLHRSWAGGHPKKEYWTNEQDCPYTEVKPFTWWRSYQMGGRSILWGRQSYRLSDIDFEANIKDGHGVDWPIRYKDLAPWYDHVEKFAGISGSKEGLAHLPDGQFLPPMDLNIVEKDVAARLKASMNRHLIIGRVANLTAPIAGRTNCQFRNRCWEGCPFGGYFSTQSSTLPAAVATGNLTVRPMSIVTKLLYDKDTKKDKGVEVLDSETNQTVEYYSKIVFVNASALNSTWVLMNTATDVWQDGLGSSSGELGHNVMDHHYNIGASGEVEGYEDKTVFGRRPNGFYITRFANLPNDKKRDYVRGFGYQGQASRESWSREIAELNIGASFKEALTEPGRWRIGATGFGEILPYHDNKISLDKTKKDKWGLPVLAMDAEMKENELKMREDIKSELVNMFEVAGVKNVHTYDGGHALGHGVHEMGTARMGLDAKTSVLNGNNQVWDAKNVFVTDGAAMTSSACQNPSLTYMALTARAANFAVEELKKGNL
jgi:choline dehydrogenase-like flavoprotein